jgi:hypothetical protein
MHPDKIFLKTFASGVDFLGWVHFPHHSVLRTRTKKRMFKKVYITMKPETLSSYIGLLKHGNGHKLYRNMIDHMDRLDYDTIIDTSYGIQ